MTKNPHAVAIGRLGGLRGGRARAKKLTHEQMSEIGRLGALKKWENRRKEKEQALRDAEDL